MKKKDQYFTATDEFRQAVINYSQSKSIPKWMIAAASGVHPSILSRAVNGRILWRPEMPKLKKLAHKINFKGECFTKWR